MRLTLLMALGCLSCGGEDVERPTPSDTTPAEVSPVDSLFIGCHVMSKPDTDAILMAAGPTRCDQGLTTSHAEVPSLDAFRLDATQDGTFAFTWEVVWPETMFVQPPACHTFRLIAGEWRLTWEHVLDGKGDAFWRRASAGPWPDTESLRQAGRSQFDAQFICDWVI